MRKLTLAFSIGLLVLVNSVPVHGAIERLVPGVVNKLEDTDFETLVNFDPQTGEYSLLGQSADTTVDEGDLLAGIFRIQALYTDDGTLTFQNQLGNSYGTTPPPGPAITGVFVTQVIGKSGNDTDGFEFDLGVAPDAAWSFLDLTRNSTDTMAIIYDDSSSPFISPSNPVLSLANLQAALASADGSLLWEFGRVPLGSTFWQAATSTDDALDVDAGGQSGFQAGLNVTYQGSGPSLTPFEILNDLGFDTPAGLYDLQLQGTFEAVTTANPILPVQTDTDLYLLPAVPEPVSAFIWLGLCGLVSMLVPRRVR